jgi:hypothetical protein
VFFKRREEREYKNKQTYLLWFLKKEEERAEEGERGTSFPLL